jgi:integrase/recombinase XerD
VSDDMTLFEGDKPAHHNAGKKFVPTLLEADEISALMAACGDQPAGVRDRALIALLYRTGMTVLEAVSLKLGDLDLTPGKETARADAGDQLQARTLALDGTVMRALRSWLVVRERYALDDHLFCSTTGRKMASQLTHGAVRLALRKLAPKAGLPDVRVHPQAFRFSLTAELMVEQWPLPYIMAQLGLTSLYSFWNFFKHLQIEPPPDLDVVDLCRERPLPPFNLSP